MEWWPKAACADEDPELFFPVTRAGPGALQEARAKAVCGRCPVTEPCLEWALRTGQDAGIWGGASEEDRRAIRRRRGMRQAGAEPSRRGKPVVDSAPVADDGGHAHGRGHGTA